jgi:hypothetical protein
MRWGERQIDKGVIPFLANALKQDALRQVGAFPKQELNWKR